MSDPVEQAAEAIWRAEGRLISQIWAWDELHEETQAHYLKLARAAIDALGLQEEWTALPRERLYLGAPKLFPSYAAAKAHRDGWVPGWVLFSRLVSRWVGEETKP